MGVIASVPARQAPTVQVVVEAGTVPAGTPYTVTGHASGGYEWPVRAGARTSDGTQAVLGDPICPINTPVTYRATWDGGQAVSAAVRRPWSGYSLLTDITGNGAVDLLWQGDDARETDPRVTLHEVPGRPTPVAVFAPAMGAGTVSLTARTTPSDTAAMLALAARPAAAALFHNPARCWQCRWGTCDVPLVTIMALTSVSHARSPRLDVAERIWTLKGAVISVPEPGVAVPTSTWDDLDAAGLAWAQIPGVAGTWNGFDRVLWQEAGA